MEVEEGKRRIFSALLAGVGIVVIGLSSVGSAHAQIVEYIHTDALGSPVAVTNSAGQEIETERTEYGPYGEQLNRATDNRPGYAGHVGDSTTGLSYMQQRYYDPQIGRFLSVDPVRADGSGSFNRYWYANNSPYNFTDPDGREAACVTLKVNCFDSGGTLAQKAGALAGLGGSLVGTIMGGTLAFGIAAQVSKYGIAGAAMANADKIVGAGVVTAEAVAGAQIAPRAPIAGGGAALENVTANAAQRIQNAANRSGQTITLVGSRAAGTATESSDWDFVVSANAAARNSLSRSLPGAGNLKEGARPNIDIFKGEVDRTRPFIDFLPPRYEE